MPVNIIVDDVYIGESQEFAEFRIRLDARSTEIITVNWSTSSYTADTYSDFAYGNGTLTFTPGETVKTVRVPIVDDGRKEGTEAFAFELSNPTNAEVTRPVALAFITDNDAAPGKPVVSVGDLVVDEADGTASFVVTLDRPSNGTVSVSYTTQNGTAVAGADYKATAGTLRFAAGETAKVVKVGIVNDKAIEGAEAFNLVLTKLLGATSLDPVGTAVIATSDLPAVQTPNLLVDDIHVDESTAFAEFQVRLDAPSTETVTVNWSTSAYTAETYSDFAYGRGILTFAAGETIKTVRVPIVDDGKKEGTEAFAFELRNAVNAEITRPVALAFITDNDAAPGKPVVSVGDLVVDEADGTASFVVTLDRPSNGTVSVSYTTQNGTAVAGADYKATAGTLRFAAGETAKVVKVGIVNDKAIEGAEAFNLVLTKLLGATSLDPVGTAVIATSDLRTVQTPNLLVDDIHVDESTAFAEFQVRLDAPSTETVTVNWSTSAYTAETYGDFTYGRGLLTFAAGETIKTVRVPIVNDGKKEGIEAFAFELRNAVNAEIARPVALGFITDNDAAPGKPVVSVGDLVMDEADGMASFVVTLDRPSNGTVSVDYTTQNGTAVAGADYKAAAGTLRFAAGETAKVVKVSVNNDKSREGVENFHLALSNLVGATSVDAIGTAVIAASDQFAVQTPNLMIDDVYVGESTAFAEFQVRLDAPSTETVTVNWSTSAYTAETYRDFTYARGLLTFAAGETIKTIRVPIVDDGAREGTEVFRVGLSNATNAEILRPTALGTILDSDGPPPPVQTISGGGAADILLGTGRADVLFGGNGDDFLSGGAGADSLWGGLGNDVYLVDNARDAVREGAGAGNDTVQSTVSFALSAHVESLLLIGGGAINGSGNELANRIAGNGAANILDGKAGADTLSGGAGADTFLFTTALGATNVDRITDFAAEDTIRLSKSVFSALAAGKLSASAFKETSAGGRIDGDDRILYSKATGALSYDADGSGKAFAAVQFAVLDNKAALTFQDFLIG